MMNSLMRRLAVLIVFGLVSVFSLSASAAEGVACVRSLKETLEGLQRIARQGNLSFQEMRDLNEAIARLQNQVQQKSLNEEEQEVVAKLKELVVIKAESEPRDRMAQLTAAKVLSIFGDPLQALEFFRKTRARSAEDIEWPLLATRIYLQLGDYAKAAIYARTVDKLLGKQTPLSMSVPVRVEQVQSYRLYTPYNGASPKPGDTLILYIEVDGARFRVQQQGMYACSLDFALELRDELQNVVDEKS